MIFVTAGTTNFPFKRLEEIVLDIGKEVTDEQIIFQISQSTLASYTQNIKIKEFIKPGKFNDYLMRADYILSHAGYATVMKSLRFGRRIPVVLPRKKKYGEHVNDHQVNFAKYMQKKGLISLWDSDSNISIIRGEKVDRKKLDNYLESLNRKRSKLIDYLDRLTLNMMASYK